MRTIGILVDRRVYRKMRLRSTGTERVKFYNKAAHRLGVSLLYMSLSGIQLRSGHAMGLLRFGNQYIRGIHGIPKVIHNRTFPQGRIERQRLRGLGVRSYVFNAQNRYSKYRIHRLLANNVRLRHYLPHSRSYSKSNLLIMMRIHDTLFIKPQRGSIGRGIIRIQHLQGRLWSIRSSRGIQTLSMSAMRHKVQQYVGRRSYLIQKGVQLATHHGRPYDIRVSVQRVPGGKWQITGMVGKVARSGSHVTNVARGGTVRKCGSLFRHSHFPVAETRARVASVSLKLANYLGRRLYRLADIGFDIGISQSGDIYFIEMNCRDQRYSFAKAGLHDIFYRTYENPLRYATYLIRSSR